MLKLIFVMLTTIISASFVAVWTRDILSAGHWYAAPVLVALPIAVAWTIDTPENRKDFVAQLKALVVKTLRLR